MSSQVTADDMLEICAGEFRRLSDEEAKKSEGTLTLVEREQAKIRANRFAILAEHCDRFRTKTAMQQDVVAS